MSSGLKTVVRRLRGMAGLPKIKDCSDRHLLERFAQTGEQAAFAALVERHGALVLGVCRRVLQNAEDAEDAFQATFMVLARKAGAEHWQSSISNWLYGVAYRVAMKTRGKRIRQRNHELAFRQQPEGSANEAAPADQITWGELRTLLDAELQRLPARYRTPLLLCYLEGKTRDEAAQQLGWSPGSVKGRLERGRELLRRRLAQRGLTISAVLCASFLPEPASAAVPATLAAATVQNATGFAAGQTAGVISSQVLSLAQGVIRTMLITKIKFIGSVMVGISLLSLGAVATHSAFSAGAPLVAEDDCGRDGGINGVVKAVDPQKGTITVHTFASERAAAQTTTYNLASKDVKVSVGETTAKLTDLIEGTRVILRLSGDDDVLAISAVLPTLRVRLKAVDAANKTVTVLAGEGGETKELKLAADARIPEKVEPGSAAEVVLSLDRSTVVSLQTVIVRRDGDQPREGVRRDAPGVNGVVVGVAPEKNTIEVLTGGDDNVKITSYQITKDTQLVQDERAQPLQLDKIARATRVVLRLADDGKTVTHLQVFAPSTRGTITSVDAKSIAINMRGQQLSFKLAENVVIRLGDQALLPTELKAGMLVILGLNADRSEVTTIRAMAPEGIRRDGEIRKDGEVRKDGEGRKKEGEIRKDGERRDGDIRKDAERRDGVRRDAPREGDLQRPVERREGQPQAEPRRDGQ